MKLRRFLLKTSLLVFIGILSCKSSQPAYEFVEPTERVGWQQKIQSGDVGFYDVRQEKTANIDSLPKVKEAPSFDAVVDVPNSCIEHARQSRQKMVGKVEFLINKKGKADNFFMLKDVGECNAALAKSFKEVDYIPAVSDGEPVATVVHFTMIFRFVNQGLMQQSVN